MNKYKVTFELIENASRDIDLDKPKTIRVPIIVSASKPSEALRFAEIEADKLPTSKLSVWDYTIKQIP